MLEAWHSEDVEEDNKDSSVRIGAKTFSKRALVFILMISDGESEEEIGRVSLKCGRNKHGQVLTVTITTSGIIRQQTQNNKLLHERCCLFLFIRANAAT